MIKVICSPDRPIDYWIRLFNQKVTRDGVLKEVEARRYYMKPSQKRQLRRKAKQLKINESKAAIRRQYR